MAKQSKRASNAVQVYGAKVPAALHEAIEAERDNLSKADSVLGCLAIALEYAPRDAQSPYFADVAQVARELLRRSIGQLDALALQKLLSRNKVREGALREYRMCSWMPKQEYPVAVERIYPLLPG